MLTFQACPVCGTDDWIRLPVKRKNVPQKQSNKCRKIAAVISAITSFWAMNRPEWSRPRTGRIVLNNQVIL